MHIKRKCAIMEKWVEHDSPLRIIIRSHFISRAVVFLIRLERIKAFSDLPRIRKNF
jgi:hypothetical protein